MKAFVWIALMVGAFLLDFSSTIEAAFGFGKSDRVRLEDISVLTLHHGKMTTGRRSSPVKQLICVGGSAANAFTPQVVQCYNRGSDGYDVQWECKSDMDNAYRFGQIEVICEGYDSPNDDYILRGSCGVEYTLEYTKEGMQQKNSGGNYHGYYGNDDDASYDNYYNHSKQKSGKTDWIFLAIVAVLMYVMYRTCIANAPAESSTAGTDDGYPGPRGTGFGPGGGGGAPPPPGFRDDGYSGASCGGSRGYSSGSSRGTGTGGGGLGGGGFWTGAAAGGLLGYLFGGNRNRGYSYGGYGGYGRPRYGYTAPRYNSGFSSGWGSSSRSGGFSGFGGGGGSSGTRTASGFGGTRRR